MCVVVLRDKNAAPPKSTKNMKKREREDRGCIFGYKRKKKQKKEKNTSEQVNEWSVLSLVCM